MTLEASVVLVAAGKAARMEAAHDLNKVYLPLGDRPVLAHALAAFDRHPKIRRLIVVVAPGEESVFERTILKRFPVETPLHLIQGGQTRQDSVHQGVRQIDEAWPLVLIHDGARPLVRAGLIDRILEAADEFGAALPGLPLTDSIKRVDAVGRVIESPDREGLYRVQTPQGFRVKLLQNALTAASAKQAYFTDDAGVVAQFGGVQSHVVSGDPFNVKITTPSDLQLAQVFYRYLSDLSTDF